MSTPCCACDKPAACHLRIVPRRDVEPLTIAPTRYTGVVKLQVSPGTVGSRPGLRTTRLSGSHAMSTQRITVSLACAQCGRHFEHSMRRGDIPPKLCSPACRRQWREATLFAPLRKTRQQTRACWTCERPYVVTKSDIARRQKLRHCSHECRTAYANRPDMVRFWESVDKHGPIPEYAPHLGPCWIWTAGTFTGGYGTFRQRDTAPASNVRAHVWGYRNLIGSYDPTLQLDHLCRVRNCVNPGHLEPVTPGENARRGMAPMMVLHRAGVCKRGHAQTPDNVYTSREGRPFCRECLRITARQRYHRYKAQETAG